MESVKKQKRVRRHARIRSRIKGTQERPRFAVFRSNRFLYAQLINDDTATTIASGNTKEVTGKNKQEQATELGALIAKRAKDAGVTQAVFDRGGFLYAGIIKAVAEGARKAGLSI